MEITILSYSIQPLFNSKCYFFSHATYTKDLLLNLRLNSYKIWIIFDTYLRMRVKWTCWAWPSIWPGTWDLFTTEEVWGTIWCHSMDLYAMDECIHKKLQVGKIDFQEDVYCLCTVCMWPLSWKIMVRLLRVIQPKCISILVQDNKSLINCCCFY